MTHRPDRLKHSLGRVWEWCATKFQDGYQDYREDNDPEGDARRVLRGGYFYDSAAAVRCGRRLRLIPRHGCGGGGFRLVVS
ncbi:MAG: SUMF1/EgtB/PvdO family nonheme iron enzyme, partial [Anaerolineae bacterium]